jgi:hypothetical protein
MVGVHHDEPTPPEKNLGPPQEGCGVPGAGNCQEDDIVFAHTIPLQQIIYFYLF